MAEADSARPSVESKTSISPHLALELRIRQLNALLTGQPTLTSTSDLQPVLYQLSALETRFTELTDSSDGVRRFSDAYDLNAPLLSLQQPHAHATPPQDPDWLTKAILVLEQEQDLVAIERDLREIQVLVEQRHADQPGKLESSKALQAPLEELKQKVDARAKALDALEDQTTALLGEYNTYINGMSEQFIAINDLLTKAEAAVSRMEKERA